MHNLSPNAQSNAIVVHNGAEKQIFDIGNSQADRDSALSSALAVIVNDSMVVFPESEEFNMDRYVLSSSGVSIYGNNCKLVGKGYTNNDAELWYVSGNDNHIQDFDFEVPATSGSGRGFNIRGDYNVLSNLKCLGTFTRSAQGSANPILIDGGLYNVVENLTSLNQNGAVRDDGSHNTWRNGLIRDFSGAHAFTVNSNIANGEFCMENYNMFHTEANNGDSSSDDGLVNFNPYEGAGAPDSKFRKVTFNNCVFHRLNVPSGGFASTNLVKVQAIETLSFNGCSFETNTSGVTTSANVDLLRFNEATDSSGTYAIDNVAFNECYLNGSIAGGVDDYKAFSFKNCVVDMTKSKKGRFYDGSSEGEIDVLDLKNTKFIGHETSGIWFHATVVKRVTLDNCEFDGVGSIIVFTDPSGDTDLTRYRKINSTVSNGKWFTATDAGNTFEAKQDGSFYNYLGDNSLVGTGANWDIGTNSIVWNDTPAVSGVAFWIWNGSSWIQGPILGP